MNCDDVQKFIHAYLDGEFDEADEASLRTHVGACAYCREVVEFEQAFRRRLETVSQPSAPEGLRARIVASLDEVEAEGLEAARADEAAERDAASAGGLWGFLSLAWVRRGLVPAVGLTAALVAAFVVMRAKSTEQAQDMAEASIRWHRRRVPLDVRASSLAAIRRFFSDKVKFNVRAPHFRSGVRARLVGARLTNLGAHEAAYLVYDVGGRRLSVFVVDKRALPSGAARGRIGGQPVFVHDAHGYRAMLYQHNGTGYAVTSDMDRRNLVRLISATK